MRREISRTNAANVAALMSKDFKPDQGISCPEEFFPGMLSTCISVQIDVDSVKRGNQDEHAANSWMRLG